jgi:ubiquitin C-terminal hydrolase
VLFHEGGARETPPLTELEVKFEAELKRQAQTAWERRLAEKGRSIITDHLHGQLKQSARCLTCGSVTVTFPLFVYLELSLQPGDPEPVPLDLLLKRFGEELCVPNHNCPRCSQKGGKKTQAMVSRQLWRLPDVAMLRIGRVFHPTPSEDIKITLRVAFPVAALDLGACIAATSPFRPARASMAVSAAQPDAGHLASSSSGDHADGLFDLYAVLHHQGQTPVQGHYVADVRHASDNNFYNINDTKIVPCELAPQPPPAEVAERGGPNAERPVFVSSDAYILFYESRVSSGERAFFTGRRNLADERNKCRGCL